MTDSTIRLATIRDAADLARLLSPLGYTVAAEDIQAIWPDWTASGHRAMVAETTGLGVVGVITLHHMYVLHRSQPVGRITSLYVADTARGRGLGKALVAAAEAALVARGCGLVEVTSHMRREDAHRFYEHLGYRRSSFRFVREVG